MLQRSNLFSQIQNGQNKLYIEVPFSKFAINFLQILQEDGFISHWTLISPSPSSRFHIRKIQVFFHPRHSKRDLRFSLKIISTPRRPCSLSLKSLHNCPSIHTYIISTSRGLINDRDARQYRLGGEFVCIISIN